MLKAALLSLILFTPIAVAESDPVIVQATDAAKETILLIGAAVLRTYICFETI